MWSFWKVELACDSFVWPPRNTITLPASAAQQISLSFSGGTQHKHYKPAFRVYGNSTAEFVKVWGIPTATVQQQCPFSACVPITPPEDLRTGTPKWSASPTPCNSLLAMLTPPRQPPDMCHCLGVAPNRAGPRSGQNLEIFASFATVGCPLWCGYGAGPSARTIAGTRTTRFRRD